MRYGETGRYGRFFHVLGLYNKKQTAVRISLTDHSNRSYEKSYANNIKSTIFMSAGAAYGRLRTARTLSNVVRFSRDAPELSIYLYAFSSSSAISEAVEVQ